MRAKMEFEWDENKAQSNFIRDGVSFQQAAAAFSDPNAIEVEDNREDYGEIRIQLIASPRDEILLIVYTECATRIRIISARRATKDERQRYYSQITY